MNDLNNSNHLKLEPNSIIDRVMNQMSTDEKNDLNRRNNDRELIEQEEQIEENIENDNNHETNSLIPTNNTIHRVYITFIYIYIYIYCNNNFCHYYF